MRIAIITGSRADHGPLEMVCDALANTCADDFRKMPLTDEVANRRVVYQNFYSRTHSVRWIDVSPASYKPNFGSEAVQVAASAATVVSGELAAIPTDLVIAHGDRYEVLGAVMGANMMGVPVAHLAGGDVTEGSADDAFRHAITKFSHLHFPNRPESAARIIQMGEDPATVHMVGDPAIDRIMRTPLLEREATFVKVGLALDLSAALVVLLHPDLSDIGELVNAVLAALRGLVGHVGIVLIGPNADPGHKTIELAWQLLASSRPNTVYCPDLPADVFLSLLKHCNALVGNSSAGFYEAPCFDLPVINIGDRQKGRIASTCVWTLEPDAKEILEAIKTSIVVRAYGTKNLYGDGHAAERIAEVIRNISEPKRLLRKRFQTLELGRHSSPESMGLVPRAARGEVREAASGG